MPDPVETPAVRPGRRPVTSPHELERTAFELFERHGFEATTVNEIARAAGIGRRTFFRYFDSKNDVVWGNFAAQLDWMRARFSSSARDVPLMVALRDAVVEFNRFDPAEVPWHRRRMELILRVPALQAHSTLRYAEWRGVVAEFVAGRLGTRADELVPRAVAHTALGLATTAYERWLDDPRADLGELIARAFAEVEDLFAAAERSG